jgi:hypothetical protein
MLLHASALAQSGAPIKATATMHGDGTREHDGD